MIVVECLYTSNEIEEETILREQQKRCLAAAASYGWAVRRELPSRLKAVLVFVLFAAGHNHRAVLNLKFRRHVFGQLNGRAAF